MGKRLIYGAVALGALAVLGYSVPLVAHHAFGAEFDANAPIRLEGRIVRVEWVNPHSWIHIEVDNPDGSADVWMVEGGTPNVLLRRGLRRECLQIGEVLVVDGYQAKNHSLMRANGRDVTFTDGRKFFMGSSGTGAPVDGAERRSLEQGRVRC
ncbi:MAG: DUF6152 family protein [Gammaproteobacteria bacterium]|nr:DUF6152 family protein [Gammaproteobacteria bacterium]